MIFSYNGNLGTDKDKVRFNIGDTVENTMQYTDSEIYAILEQETTVRKATSRLLKTLITKYSLKASETVGKIKIDYAGVVENLKEALKLYISSSVTIYAGGMSKSGKEVYSDNSDLVQPYFYKGLRDENKDC